MDFVSIDTRLKSNGTMEIYPKFHIRRSKDLMIRGGAFYAVWDESTKCWTTDVQRCFDMIDSMIGDKYAEMKKAYDGRIKALYMFDCDSKSVDRWNHYVKHQMYDNFKQLDDSIIFANDPWEREQYSSHRLTYALQEGPLDNYEKLMSTLYSPDERRKIEWAIGSVVCGDSKWIQKFLVFVGDHGTGKSTVLKIIRKLFGDYTATIDAKAMGSSNAAFSLESLRNNPLVAIEDDTDLSKIEDNTRINSIVSHEPISMNVKYQSSYPVEIHAMLFLGTNKEVKITDSRSGLIRRLIDVKPSGNKLPVREYRKAFDGTDFELGAIAKHCLDVYKDDPYIYDDYVPTEQIRSTNIAYSWLEEQIDRIEAEDGISLGQAWLSFKSYCQDAGFEKFMNKQQLKNELKGYFHEFLVDGRKDDGTRVYNYFYRLKLEKFGREKPTIVEPEKANDIPEWLQLDKTESLLDDMLGEYPAQYARMDNEKPRYSWANVKTTLADLDTSKIHYTKIPANMIFIDFDLKNEEGEKDAQLNIEAASQFPPTYAEYSKGGSGLHLYYIYDGDVDSLSAIYTPHIEIKVLKGDASLRRRVSFCNDIPVAHISSGLPLKEVKTDVKNGESLKNEKALRTLIMRALKKEYPPHSTVSMISFIDDNLKKAYNAGIKYDVSDLRAAIDWFAANSTHHADECMEKVMGMKFSSEEPSDEEEYTIVYADENVFYDVEVFPNLFVVVWKPEGKEPVTWINPSPEQCEYLMCMKLIGFNNRKYDNHIIYARAMGYTIEGLYKLSHNIIKNGDGFFREAYNISYTDIYDYAKKKQSLKKWEIELGIFHLELGLPWDETVPEELWQKVAEYCVNDVVATEAVFNATQGDFIAREILAKLTGMTPNATTNTLTGKLIFGDERHPHGKFCYRDLSKPVIELDDDVLDFLSNEVGMKIPFDDKSLLPYFPEYSFDQYRKPKSIYKGFDVGEGGFVYAEPGIYYNVALIDIESMHPNSAVDECIFGVRFTRIFRQLLQVRVAIKHRDFESARHMFDGKLAEFLNSPETADQLEQALKIAINSVYGLTSASFENLFNDPRNVDNIVAKRGALFMIDLKEAVEARGFTVAHIKTDSIKIPNATPEIIEFCKQFAKRYGYNFDHEATYERMCLVNNAVYVARYATVDECSDLYGDGYLPSKQKKKAGEWTATGTQFRVPYVFKTLFSHEQVTFEDICETKSVKEALYLDTGVGDDHDYHFVGKVGQFTPVKEGAGGGLLMSKIGDKYNAATGTKGYLWQESAKIREIPYVMDIVDLSYHNKLVDDAVDTINKYGDAWAFIGEYEPAAA